MVAKHLKRILPAILMTACAGQAVAQPAPQLSPATPADMFTYTFMGAVSVCNSVQNNITTFDKALANSIAVSVITIANKHKSQISEGGKTLDLNPQQIESGVGLQTFAQIERICGKDIKGENKKQYEAVKAQVEKALKSAQPKKSN